MQGTGYNIGRLVGFIGDVGLSAIPARSFLYSGFEFGCTIVEFWQRTDVQEKSDDF